MPTTTSINRDTTLCLSLAARPSNIGTRFHNWLYDELGLDFVYKAFTTTDLPAAVAGIRALGIRGCGVSMPFKEDCIPLVDEMDRSAREIHSVNTIVNTGGRLIAYNTDCIAIARLLESNQVASSDPVAVFGSGGMAKAVVAALRDAGYRSGHVVARNEESGTRLAGQYGFDWVPEIGALRPRLIVNATPIGMAGGPAADDLPCPIEVVHAAETVFEVVAMPVQTPLVQVASATGKKVITGAQVIALQAVEQFVLYTGVRPTDAQAAKASEFSRA